MASIIINAQVVVKACNKAIENYDNLAAESHQNWLIEKGKSLHQETLMDIQFPSTFTREKNNITKIKELANFSEKSGLLTITIDQDDFELIGEYLK